MDPYDRFEARRRKINIEAIAAFLVGVVVAYILQYVMGFGGGGLFTVLIVLAVGGFWYHLRRVF
jgi:hypothetical protein